MTMFHIYRDYGWPFLLSFLKWKNIPWHLWVVSSLWWQTMSPLVLTHEHPLARPCLAPTRRTHKVSDSPSIKRERKCFLFLLVITSCLWYFYHTPQIFCDIAENTNLSKFQNSIIICKLALFQTHFFFKYVRFARHSLKQTFYSYLQHILSHAKQINKTL